MVDFTEYWKENWDGGDPNFTGKNTSYGFPLFSDDIGQNLTVLLCTVDANCNAVGYVLIHVTTPSRPS
jgi:hypothetical protein